MRAYRSGAEIDHISARSAPAHSAFTISIAFICTYAIFALAVIPFAGNPGPKFRALSRYLLATVFVTELSTSLLLFVHFRAHPHWSLLILGSAFLYSALMVVPHLLTFPGAVLTGQTLVGGSRQATGYIFVFMGYRFCIVDLCFGSLRSARQPPSIRSGASGSSRLHRCQRRERRRSERHFDSHSAGRPFAPTD